MRWVVLLLLVGCGGDAGRSDATATSQVAILAPNGGESLIAAEELTVRWTAETALTYDLALVDASGAATPIESGIAGGSFAWTPIGVPAPTRYRIRVTASDGASDESDADFTVSPPPGVVSFAATLQPIFTASCTAATCHDTQTQAASLNLTAGRAYASLVGVSSQHAACVTFQRVLPAEPDQSFLVFKLDGTGACFAGVPMPKNAARLPAAQIQLVREWIAGGAKHN